MKSLPPRSARPSGPALCAFVSILATSCTPDAGESLQATAQQIRVGQGRTDEAYVGVDLLVTDSAGNALPCAPGRMDLTVSAKPKDGGESVQLASKDLEVTCAGAASDVALVIDNSGSELDSLPLLHSASEHFAERILDAGGRVSVVRVSTNAEKLLPLSRSAEEVASALDGMFVRNGWTALYDGVRMANETLGDAREQDPRKDLYANANSFCAAARKTAIIAITDGGENNSAGQELRSDEDDGLDTFAEDLQKLGVYGISTPIYTVGIGRRVQREQLSAISAASGGKYIPVNDVDDVPTALDALAEYADESFKVCGSLPEGLCGEVELQVDYTYRGPKGALVTGTRKEEVYVSCPDSEPTLAGRSVSIVLTLSNPGLDTQVAKALIKRSVDWVSPVRQPRVLVVLDDNHHGEYVQDASFIASQLTAASVTVVQKDEPADGLTDADLDGYDVVWFSNPGYPVDDERSMRSLNTFVAQGGGVVLQGDDISQAYGGSFSMAPYTHLNHLDNGTHFCGRTTDNNAGDVYTVTFAEAAHPIVSGLEGESFSYGDDADSASLVADGSVSLASASAAWGPRCGFFPVMVAYEPQ